MPRRLSRYFPLALAGAFLLGIPSAGAKRPDPFDAGFLASRHTDASGDERLKVAGPFVEMAHSTQGWHLAAFRPFYSSVSDPANERSRKDYLWPLGASRKIGNEEVSRFLLFFNYQHGEKQPNRRYRFWLLPFYFEGRDLKGERYRAIFPLGGTIREFIGQDEISFVLFPLHARSRINDVETSDWLWPIVSHTKGEGTERHRVFPFYGRSIREGQYDKRFVLWPFWTDVRYEYEGASGNGYLLFPFYGHMKLEDQESWWVLPPFFRYAKGERGSRLLAPWPFVQWETGPVEKFYLWPLWGHKKVFNHERWFLLWPIIWNEHTQRGGERQDRFMVVPFYYSSKQGVSNEPPRERSVKLWPLFSYRRVEDQSRFKTLELWPIAENPQVERNWAPFWTIYSSSRSGGNSDRELLWGLHRDQRRGPAGRFWSFFPFWEWRRDRERTSWAIFKGLLGREREHSNTAWRVLFFLNFGDLEPGENEP